MEDAGNLDDVRRHPIDDDVRQGRKRELTLSGHPATDSSKAGKIAETCALTIDCSGNPAGGLRIVPFNPHRRCAPDLRRREWTSELASGLQEPFQALANLLMREVLAAL
jgi:hypothetical protein